MKTRLIVEYDCPRKIKNGAFRMPFASLDTDLPVAGDHVMVDDEEYLIRRRRWQVNRPNFQAPSLDCVLVLELPSD